MRRWVVEDPFFTLLLHLSQEMGSEIFLVGGLVRDRLLGRETQDVDLTLSAEALRTARLFADQTGGTFVLLREEGEMARVIIKNQDFDFATFRGPDLMADLRARDFTINALALSLDEAFSPGEWHLRDPLEGINDLEAKRLKMTSAEAFLLDPLRLLRAFRFSAQLGLRIEPKTRQTLKHSATLLPRSAPERIRYEWLVLLSQPSSFTSILDMEETGVLETLFPEMTVLRDISQDRYHHLDVFGHSLLTYQSLEKLFQGEFPLPTDLEKEMAFYLHDHRRPGWLKWAALLHDLGKAETAGEKNGHRIFYGHAEASQRQFELIAERFRLGHPEQSFLRRLIGGHMRPLFLAQEEGRGRLSRRALNRFVHEASEELSGFFLLALADSLAAQGPEKPSDMEALIKAVWRQTLLVRQEWLTPVIKKPPLLSGKDLIEFGLTPGPSFKILLCEILEEQWEGTVRSKEEALTWLKKRLTTPLKCL